LEVRKIQSVSFSTLLLDRAINVAIIDLGNRLIVNEVHPVKPLQPLPRLVEVPTRL
jgi:L-arabinose isomerase